MTQVTLGRTGLTVNKNGFGALPIQRVSREEAVHLLRKALDAGIDFSTRPGFIRTARKRSAMPSAHGAGSFT